MRLQVFGPLCEESEIETCHILIAEKMDWTEVNERLKGLWIFIAWDSLGLLIIAVIEKKKNTMLYYATIFNQIFKYFNYFKSVIISPFLMS